MDTRFWGPSGWRLLHLITFAYEPKQQKDVCAFFYTLPYILPCKFCRYSLSEHLEAEPPEQNCQTAPQLQKWLWRLHNKVNAKLRKQGLCRDDRDPPFEDVERFYTEKLASGCSRTTFDGWNFLFSVAENHPFSRTGRSSRPFDGVPPAEQLNTPFLRNKWNVMAPAERMGFYLDFWKYLPRVLPFPEWRRIWSLPTEALDSRKTSLEALWKLRCHMERELELLNRTTFSSLCQVLKEQRSGCNTASSSRSKTCRKKKRLS